MAYLLSSPCINVASRDNNGRKAISWAAAGKHYKVVEHLIEYDGPGVDREDIDGWTPLAWALSNFAPKTVQTLLSSGLVNTNKKDLNGKKSSQFCCATWVLEGGKIASRCGGNSV
jgi:ankyrin repeat domain-containing protein 50